MEPARRADGVYLASDAGVAIAELARHHGPDDEADDRRVLRLVPAAAIMGLVDLRDDAVPGPGSTSRWPRSWTVSARSLAGRIRADARHAGLIVPSMAFLDDPSRCNVVLFAELFEEISGRRFRRPPTSRGWSSAPPERPRRTRRSRPARPARRGATSRRPSPAARSQR